MGYFSNGTEGEDYWARWCRRCVHDNLDTGCAVWLLHMEHNYKECNNRGSFLHTLIPYDGRNGQCRMFWEKK